MIGIPNVGPKFILSRWKMFAGCAGDYLVQMIVYNRPDLYWNMIELFSEELHELIAWLALTIPTGHERRK